MSDFSHCPNKEGTYFSPVAPPELCQVHQVPEPSGFALVFVALVVMLWCRRVR